MNYKPKPVAMIPCLGVCRGRVVKGHRRNDTVDMGDPVEWAVRYEQAGADALAFLDILAVGERRRPAIDMLRNIVDATNIPVMAIASIRSVAEAELLLTSGASRISFNLNAPPKRKLIQDVARSFGAGYIGMAFEADFNPSLPSRREVCLLGEHTPIGLDAVEFAKSMVDAGVGYLIPTSRPCDGARRGYDVELIRTISDVTGLPTAASGGAGALVHFYEAVRDGHADMLLAASVFLYKTFTLQHIKMYLALNHVPVQNPPDALAL